MNFMLFWFMKEPELNQGIITILPRKMTFGINLMTRSFNRFVNKKYSNIILVGFMNLFNLMQKK